MSIDLESIEEIRKQHQIILFDGVCNLCNQSVQVVIKNDAHNVFRFAALQSDKGLNFIKKNDLVNIDSILLITQNQIYTKSSAALQIAKQLKGVYPLLFVFYPIPKAIRDWVYVYIAKNRYRWFGKKEHCMVPSTELKEKFI
ncbi:thiol-disulfide oxidoreductase DCC family protein [Ochrovirga pacifica]|uniref:thiol-disulfide oxidoreductase DCC family protein n=1 Tax=Ochrovirga pacifica TaxID=1042376 RepID=UPI0002558368|nr:DUF393 domain-containing protein [Ochrovirga pacifica]